MPFVTLSERPLRVGRVGQKVVIGGRHTRALQGIPCFSRVIRVLKQAPESVF